MEADVLFNCGCYLIILVYGIHIIRALSFNRYEAVTIECSAVASLLLVLWSFQFGQVWWHFVLSFIFFVAYVGNAIAQRYYYEVLQNRLDMAFSKREKYLNGPRKDAINELRNMAAVAIMPTFSRFIEESSSFNNTGSLLDLLKTIMKRKRFQKKKYLMRECFSDCVNIICPCKPKIGVTVNQNETKKLPLREFIDRIIHPNKLTENNTEKAYSMERTPEIESPIPEAMHANELALDYKDEKCGLIWFDSLGFGTLFAIWLFLSFQGSHQQLPANVNWGIRLALILPVLLLGFTILSFKLRHIAFISWLSFGYELSFSVLVTLSFFLYEEKALGYKICDATRVGFWFALLLFLAVSVFNYQIQSILHKRVKSFLSGVIQNIQPSSVTNCTKRRFFNNLMIISDWALLPFFKKRIEAKTKTDQTAESEMELVRHLLNLVTKADPWNSQLSDMSKEIQKWKKTIQRKKWIIIVGILSLAIVVLMGIKTICESMKETNKEISRYLENSEIFCPIPEIEDGFIPQGISYDPVTDSVLLTGYQSGRGSSPFFIIERKTNDVKKILMQRESGEHFKGHAGGVSLYSEEVFVAGSTENCMFVFSLEDLMKAKDGIEQKAESKVELSNREDYIRVSFTAANENMVFAGEFHKRPLFPTHSSHKTKTSEGIQRAYLLGFDLDDSNNAVPIIVYSIPDNIQGACFDDGFLYLSQIDSLLSSQILTYDLSKTSPLCTRKVLGVEVPLYVLTESSAVKITTIPPMAEEILTVDGKLLIVYESASNRYRIGKRHGFENVLATPVEFFIR